MAKLRLNERHRSALLRLARIKIDQSLVSENMQVNAQHLALGVNITQMLIERYPPGDMKVLQRYDLANVDHCVNLSFPNGRVVQYTYADEDATIPLTPNRKYCQRLPVIADLELDYDRYMTAKEDFKKTVKTRMNDYDTLIRIARYYEDVLEVWSEAEEVRVQFGATAVAVAITSDVVARIRADIDARRAIA